MLHIFQSYSREIAGLLTVVFAFGLNRIFRPRAKLIYSVRHAFTFIVEEPLTNADGQQTLANTDDQYGVDINIKPWNRASEER